jgi:hypothetical protein
VSAACESVMAALLASGPVVTLVGQRIYGEHLPQETPGVDQYPALSVSYIDGTGGYALRGSDGKARERVQVDIWTADLAAGETLRDLVGEREGIFDGFGGVFVDRKRGPTWDDEGQVYHAMVELLVRKGA